MVNPFDSEEMRRFRVWEQCYLRPHAASTSFAQLRSELQLDQERFARALAAVPPEEAYVPVGPERMSAAQIAAHVAVTLRLQTAGIRAIVLGEPMPTEGWGDDLFTSATYRPLAEIQTELDAAWEGLRTALALCSGDEPGSIPHPLFGGLNVREWAVTASRHFSYHAEQLEA